MTNLPPPPSPGTDPLPSWPGGAGSVPSVGGVGPPAVPPPPAGGSVPPPPSSSVPPPPSGPGGPAGRKPAAWYELTWAIVVLLVFCFPIGLILVWMNSRFTQKTKIVVTGIVVALFAIGAVASAASPPTETANSGDLTTTASTTASSTTEVPSTTARPTTTKSLPATTTARPTTTPPPATTAPPATFPPATAPPKPSLSAAQEQAVRSAQAYLGFKGFSRQGLIDQLSSEYGDQFSVQDATVAVDSLNVDWNAQAAKAAMAYLDFQGFSCQGLIDQLSSEYGDKFTVEQATYGAQQSGVC